MSYLKNQVKDTEMNDDMVRLRYYVKYIEYMVKNKDRIENFAKRELQKLKIMNAEDKIIATKKAGLDAETLKY